MFKLYAKWSGVSYEKLYKTYTLLPDDLFAYEKWFLCCMGVPATKMKHKTEAKEYIFKKALEYLKSINNNDK